MCVRWKTAYHTALVLATWVGSLPLAGQNKDNSDSRWLEHCQRESDDSDRERYCDVRVVHLGKSTGSLSVDGRQNGGVKIMGWDGDSVVVHILVEAQASTEAAAQELANQVQVVTATSPIHAEGPSSGHRSWWSVNYRIYVPRHTDLTLETVNGPVSVEDVSGHMDLSAINGPVDLDGIGGDVHARAQNGPLTVTLNGAKWNGTGLDAETRNGPVDLTVPKGYAAHLETGTVNGPTDINFPITVQGTLDPRRLSMDIGGGGAPVRVVTTNGPISVRQE
jgi:hypothetical protein